MKNGSLVKQIKRWVFALGIELLAQVAFAASYTMLAGSNYFSNHVFSTLAGTSGASAVTTGTLGSVTFNVSQVGSGTTQTGRKDDFAPGSLPTGSGFPAVLPDLNEVGSFIAQTTGALPPTGLLRYQFSQALPIGTHVWLQDIDTGENVGVQFFNCAGTVINPSGFDFIKVSGSSTATPTFSATNVTLTQLGTTVTEPLVGLIIRDPNVCRIEYDNVTAVNFGGTFEIYYSLPPTDIDVTKTMVTPASPTAIQAGGSTGVAVSWTATIVNTTPASAFLSGVIPNPVAVSGVTFSDTVNTNITGVTATITNAGGTTGGSCTVSGANVVSCSGFSALASGSSIVLTLSGTLAANYVGATLPNTGTTTFAPGVNDTSLANNSSTSTTPVVRAVNLTKVWSAAPAGNAVSLAISGTNVSSAVAGTSTAPATTTAASAVVGGPGGTVTLTESFTSGAAANYRTSLACVRITDGGAVTVSGSGLSRTITMPTNSGVNCTYTNERIATLALRLITDGHQTGSVSFSTPVNLDSTPVSTGATVTPGTATAFTPAVNITAASTALSLKVVPNDGSWMLRSVICTDTNSAVTGNTNPITATVLNPNLADSDLNLASFSSFTLPAAVVRAGAVLQCTITNDNAVVEVVRHQRPWNSLA